ncbi:MAG: sugar phosphate isomerase/epimerase family protein [bacterium]
MDKMEIGVFLSSLGIRDPIAAVEKAAELGFKVVQMCALPDKFRTGPGRDDLKRALEKTGIEVSAVNGSYPGESYADIETVRRTVGFLPPETLEERIRLTYEYKDLGVFLNAKIFTTHIGVVPEDTKSALYNRLVGDIRRMAEEFAKADMLFAMETGQEKAEAMVEFMNNVGAENLKINFDPANMILYGTGEPIPAIDILKDYIVHVHVKDGTWPKSKGKLGREEPLGEGDVNIPAYIAKLKEIGYAGPLIIEREAGTDRIGDIRAAKAMLEKLRR